MTMTLQKNLTVILLLVAVLLAPVNSFALDAAFGAATDPCACHLLLTDCCEDEKGGQQNHCPGNSADGCCDCEEACADAAEQPLYNDLRVNISVRPLSLPSATNHVSKVYLTIFVPPQSCSLT